MFATSYSHISTVCLAGAGGYGSPLPNSRASDYRASPVCA